MRDEPAPEAAPENEVGALARIQRPHAQPEVVAARGEAEESLDAEVGPLGRREAQADLVVGERPEGRREDRRTGLLRPAGEPSARAAASPRAVIVACLMLQ